MVRTSWIRPALLLGLLVGGCSSGGGATDGGGEGDAEPDDGTLDLPADGDAGDDGGAEGDADVAEDGSGSPCESCPAAHATVIAGLSRIRFGLQMSRVDADRTQYVPLVWRSFAATGGDRRGLAGTLPAPGWLGTPGAGRVVVWAGHEGAWGGADDGVDDNDPFRARLLDWLLGDGRSVAFAAAHAEWLQADNLSPTLAAGLTARGVAVRNLHAPLDAGTLADVDLLVLGNPWGELPDAELDALGAWVRAGGALLVLGLGWSWPMYHPDPTGDDYPVNRLGERLGFRVMGGSIYDPDPPAGTPDAPAYPLRPLDEYRPLEVVVLRSPEDDVDRVKELAVAAPEAIYVIEGAHMGLQLPTRDWARLDDPAGALEALDRLYAAELDLAGGVNPPFDGDMIWIVPVDDPDAPWWMHSGNPIVYQAAAARTEIIPRLNAEGHPGWGVAHEQGHNMHADSCGDLFVAEGTGEVWVNVFGLYSYRQNGWDWAPQMGADLFDAGHDYHARTTPDFADLRADPFVLLGCLDLIWTRYGWDGMRRFMTRAAADTAAGSTAGDDAARVAYFVEQLSAAYEIDFAPLIAHWGFAVSPASRAATAAYPPCDIPW